MVDEAEKKRWVERNTFRCPRLAADLSPEACERNRQKPKLIYGFLPDRFQPGPCSDCADWPALCRQVELRRAGKAEEDAMAKKKKKCLECGEIKEILGRGLCGACYSRLRKAGELDKEYPLTPRQAVHHGGGERKPPECRALPGDEIPQECPTMAARAKKASGKAEKSAGNHRQDRPDILQIDLSRVPGLNEYLLRSARENLRSTIEDEVLFILKSSMREHNAHHNKGVLRPWLPGGIMPLNSRN